MPKSMTNPPADDAGHNKKERSENAAPTVPPSPGVLNPSVYAGGTEKSNLPSQLSDPVQNIGPAQEQGPPSKSTQVCQHMNSEMPEFASDAALEAFLNHELALEEQIFALKEKIGQTEFRLAKLKVQREMKEKFAAWTKEHIGKAFEKVKPKIASQINLWVRVLVEDAFEDAKEHCNWTPDTLVDEICSHDIGGKIADLMAENMRK